MAFPKDPCRAGFSFSGLLEKGGFDAALATLLPPRMSSDATDDERYEEEVSLIEELAQHLQLHHAPLVILASGRESLSDKFVALLHAFALEVGFEVAALNADCASFVVTTSDLGVEFGLNTIGKASLREVFPWTTTNLPAAHPIDEWADEDMCDPLAAQTFDLANSLGCPWLVTCSAQRHV